MLNNSLKIIVAVGGTGGHVFPAQAFSKELKTALPNAEILFAGAGLSQNTYLDKAQFSFVDINSGTPFGRNIFRAFSAIAKGFIQSIKLLRKEKPQIIVGFGSYHSFPILLASKILKIPYVLFESNAIPGKVIKLLAKKAAFTAVQLPQAKKHLRGLVKEVSMPLWLSSYSKPETKEQARKLYGLKEDLFTILVFGGSQGASSLNHTFKLTASNLIKHTDFQVLHILGKKDSVEEFKVFYAKEGITAKVLPFEENMAKAWIASDMAICRSGAATVAEILFFKVPSVLVPYPHATEGHQLVNALFFKEQGAASIVEEKDLNPQLLQNEIESMMNHKLSKFQEELDRLKEMRSATLASCVKTFITERGAT